MNYGFDKKKIMAHPSKVHTQKAVLKSYIRLGNSKPILCTISCIQDPLGSNVFESSIKSF